MQADINRIKLFMLAGLWAKVAASHLEWWTLKTNSKGPGQDLSGTLQDIFFLKWRGPDGTGSSKG